jgi:arginine decarboxylase
MRIPIASAFASGPTELAAFDSALMHAGVHNFNLIALSSVIPPGTDIEELDGPASPSGQWGDRLYVVMAERRQSNPGEGAWAGVGWVQSTSRKGLFVEHSGTEREEVEEDIRASLGGLVANRGESFGPVRMRLSGGVCEQAPVCALVVAVFPSAPWRAEPAGSAILRRTPTHPGHGLRPSSRSSEWALL